MHVCATSTHVPRRRAPRLFFLSLDTERAERTRGSKLFSQWTQDTRQHTSHGTVLRPCRPLSKIVTGNRVPHAHRQHRPSQEGRWSSRRYRTRRGVHIIVDGCRAGRSMSSRNRRAGERRWGAITRSRAASTRTCCAASAPDHLERRPCPLATWLAQACPPSPACCGSCRTTCAS